VGPGRKEHQNPVSHSTHSKSEAVSNANVLDDAKALAEKITALVGPPPALTKTTIQRSAKLRKGGASVVQTVAMLSDQFGLVVPSNPTSAMVEKVTKAQALVALHKQLVAATKHVADAMFEAQSESWAGATVHYSMLRRLAKSDGNIATALQPVTQFFAARSTAVAEEDKAKRGGARKGSAKAKAYRASQKAVNANAPAPSESQASATSEAPTTPAAQTGAPASPQATTTLANGAAH
jgi:hypothetical protein